MEKEELLKQVKTDLKRINLDDGIINVVLIMCSTAYVAGMNEGAKVMDAIHTMAKK